MKKTIKNIKNFIKKFAKVIAIYYLLAYTLHFIKISNTIEKFVFDYIFENVLSLIFSIILIQLIWMMLAKDAITVLLNLIAIFVFLIVLLLTQAIEFLPIVLLVVYVGAIAILFLFVIMLLDLSVRGHNSKSMTLEQILKALAVLMVIKTFFFTEFIIKNNMNYFNFLQKNSIDFYKEIELLGKELYNQDWLLLVLISTVLCGSLVASIILASNDKYTNYKYAIACTSFFQINVLNNSNNTTAVLIIWFIVFLLTSMLAVHKRLFLNNKREQIRRFFFFLLNYAFLVAFACVYTVKYLKKTQFYFIASKFFVTWSWHQWWTSLFGLFVIYFLFFRTYNYMAIKINARFNTNLYLFTSLEVSGIILVDILINFAIGIVYMFPFLQGTPMSLFLLKCPIALSPTILMVEVIMIVVYFLIKYFFAKIRF